jgi:hypothetical protein
MLKAREYYQRELARIIHATTATNVDTLLARAVSLHASVLSRRIVMNNEGWKDDRFRFPAHAPHETMIVETVS